MTSRYPKKTSFFGSQALWMWYLESPRYENRSSVANGISEGAAWSIMEGFYWWNFLAKKRKKRKPSVPKKTHTSHVVLGPVAFSLSSTWRKNACCFSAQKQPMPQCHRLQIGHSLAVFLVKCERPLDKCMEALIKIMIFCSPFTVGHLNPTNWPALTILGWSH